MDSRVVSATRRPGAPSALRGTGGRKPKKSKNRGRYGLFAVGAIAALIVSMTWNPPHKTVHSFTEMSDYNSERESGCTNSGKGCHGSESSYKDFNAYHPTAVCIDCHDYQGVGCIPCHSPKQHECAMCHDGTMKNSPDRVRITDSYPNGHYRETTHTVTATDMSQKLDAGGKAKTACSDCHANDLRAAHTAVPVVEGSKYGTDIGCGECHNDVRAYGQAEVLSDWKVRSCEACHKLGSSSPTHSTKSVPKAQAKSDFGCTSSGSGCHDSQDLHELHADKPGNCSGSAEKGGPGCHKLEQDASKPKAVTCGGDEKGSCHTSGDASGYTHKKMGVHSPSGSRAANATSYKGTACGACHLMASDGASLLREHSRSTSTITKGSKNSCLGCHEDAGAVETIAREWPQRSGSNACEACHDGSDIGAPHEGDFSALHAANDSDGCASSGAGCHEGNDLAAVGDGGLHKDCVRCHAANPSNGNIAYSPGKRSCGEGRDCHAAGGAFDSKTSIHKIGGVTIDGRDARFHTAGTGQAQAKLTDGKTGAGMACSLCHSMNLGVEHTRWGSSVASNCRGCHNASAGASGVVKGGWAARNTDQACVACHDGTTAKAPHAGIDAAHLATERDRQDDVSPGYCSSSRCHGSADVRAIHAKTGCMATGCHAKNGAVTGDSQMSCGGTGSTCHKYGDYHRKLETSHDATELNNAGEPSPGTCKSAGCHVSANLMLVHDPKGCNVDGCHNTTSPVTSCGGPADQPSACHRSNERHQESDAKHAGAPLDNSGKAAVAGTCDGSGCHESLDLRILHNETGCKAEGCHVDNGPTITTCGGGDSSRACHASFSAGGHGGSSKASSINSMRKELRTSASVDEAATAGPSDCSKTSKRSSVPAPTEESTSTPSANDNNAEKTDESGVDASDAQAANPAECDRASDVETATTTRISGSSEDSLCLACHSVKTD